MSRLSRQFRILCLFYFGTSTGLSSDCLPYCCSTSGTVLDVESWSCIKDSSSLQEIQDDEEDDLSSSVSASCPVKQNFVPSCASGDSPEEIDISENDLIQKIRHMRITRSLGKFQLQLSPDENLETFYNVVQVKKKRKKKKKKKIIGEIKSARKGGFVENRAGGNHQLGFSPNPIPSAFCLQPGRVDGTEKQRYHK